jgi:hypothetical protein
MRLIVLLVTLLIVSYAIYRQTEPARAPTTPGAGTETTIPVPRVPQRVDDLGTFESQMRDFMTESGLERRRRMEETDP